ncbi:hypothetical protein TVAG_242810 [Trichomonas vaginalis G3]|uniref:Ribosome control protein 1 domain-containing protein n=1 Tax=Trichomonas vaginalis (strain ATCC PRA-98 / G3) TaxID=412133 RepID=A2F840_TRIV3|nr:Rab6a-GEF complex partner protein 1 family [Trichomonas vaginalis G3]EAX98916.1 hypothetical protein TVAG_242810 [Trichomonas vaginalis G3]KAI5526707.1 Rab6a-GEF complex partner protein 1 family [Trichomonas vaginalis G3]|eukprot:XP_001311846.1 hypothetical protein [Trichomonas vaginalis G3]
MFVYGFQRVKLDSKNPAILCRRSLDDKFTACLTSKELRILNSITLSDKPLATFRLPDEKFKEYGDFTTFEWTSNRSIMALTKNHVVSILSINEYGTFVNSSFVSINGEITACCAVDDHIAVALAGPVIQTITLTGDVVGEYNIQSDDGAAINCLKIVDEVALMSFENGKFATAQIHFGGVFESRSIKVNYTMFNNTKEFIVSPDSMALSILHSNGVLSFITNLTPSTPEIKLVKNCIRSVWSSRGSYLFALSHEGDIIIINYKNRSKTKTKLELDFDPNSCTAFEFSWDYSQLILSFPTELIFVDIAMTDLYSPSLVFHTSQKVIFGCEKSVIEGPKELLSRGFTIKYAAASPDYNYIVIAGKRGFAYYSAEKDKWVFSADRLNSCQSIWFQEGYFVAIAQEETDNSWKLLLLSPDLITIVHTVNLDSPAVFVNHVESKLVLGTKKSIELYFIHKQKINLVEKHNLACRLSNGALYDFSNGILTLIDGKLTVLCSDEKIADNVITIFTTQQSPIIFILTEDNSYVYVHKRLITLKKKFVCEMIVGVCAFSLASRYKVGELKLKRHPFLANILMEFLDEPQKLYSISMTFLSDAFSLVEFVKVIQAYFDTGKTDKMKALMARFDTSKSHLLLAALLLLPEKYQPEIVKMMPNYDMLIKKFPQYGEQLNEIYQQK